MQKWRSHQLRKDSGWTLILNNLFSESLGGEGSIQVCAIPKLKPSSSEEDHNTFSLILERLDV